MFNPHQDVVVLVDERNDVRGGSPAVFGERIIPENYDCFEGDLFCDDRIPGSCDRNGQGNKYE